MAYDVHFDTEATPVEVKLSTGGSMQASFGTVQYVNTGKSGLDGTTFYPAVSEDCTLSWTNDGGKENPAPVNIKGDQGEQGEPGKDGAFTPLTNLELENLLK